ncbi:hypothetical protein RB195_012461 [Necator americanus]|uniref:CHK kinase-like domain-containing protein n=1 Tax=Necator americanus TaxID=51031 RepID=A0ABR1D812_NECAM
MALFMPGEGILRTKVSWDDLQHGLFEAFGESARFGPHKNVKDIGFGNGFLSKICLIIPDWQADFKHLPEKFVVKICSQLSFFQSQEKSEEFETEQNQEFLKTLESEMKKIHNNEVYVYRLLKKYSVSNVARPEVYYMREFSEENPLKGFIIMEYITGNLSLRIFDNFAPTDVLQVLRQIASLEAASLKFTDDDKALLLRNRFKGVFAKALTKEIEKESSHLSSLNLPIPAEVFPCSLDRVIWVSLWNILPGLALLKKLGGDRLKKSIERLEATVLDIIDLDFADSLSDTLGMKRVLCHGDLWTTNIIWKKRQESIELAALIDFQISHFGCPAVDVVRVLSACLSAKDRREHWKNLLENFYCFLEEEVGDHEMPYTLEQLKHSYRLFFPLGAYMTLPMVVPVFQLANDSDDLEHKRRELIFEKTEGLLEDIVTFHEANKNKTDV